MNGRSRLSRYRVGCQGDYDDRRKTGIEEHKEERFAQTVHKLLLYPVAMPTELANLES